MLSSCSSYPRTANQKWEDVALVCDSENHRSKNTLIEAQSGLACCWAQKGSQITAPSPRYYKQRPPPTKTRLSSFSVFPLNTTTNEYPPTTATTFRLRSQSSTDTHPSSYSFNTLHQFFTMPPKAAAPKAKAASSDHASYQGKLEFSQHHLAMRSRMVFLGRMHRVQLWRALVFGLERGLTRFRRHDHRCHRQLEGPQRIEVRFDPFRTLESPAQLTLHLSTISNVCTAALPSRSTSRPTTRSPRSTPCSTLCSTARSRLVSIRVSSLNQRVRACHILSHNASNSSQEAPEEPSSPRRNPSQPLLSRNQRSPRQRRRLPRRSLLPRRPQPQRSPQLQSRRLPRSQRWPRPRSPKLLLSLRLRPSQRRLPHPRL